MELIEQMEKVVSAYDQLFQVKEKMSELIKESLEKHRVHQQGDVVEVYDEMDRYLGDGIVGQARTCVFLSDVLTLKQYLKKPDTLLKDAETIRYEVFAINKNGKPSVYHFMGDQHRFLDIKNIEKPGHHRYIKQKNK